VDQSTRTKGHQITTIAGNKDHIEDSLPSRIMEEEEEEHVTSFRRHK